GLEALRVPDGPARQKSAVASAEHAEPIRVDERVARERFVERGHHVRVVAPAPVPDHGLGEGLTVPLTAPRIRVDDRIAGAGVHLELVEEIVAVLSVRATVDVEKRGVAMAGEEGGWAQHSHAPIEASLR